MNQYQTELYHHGIKGQRWGVRRFQNTDGTLTAEGARRYSRADQKRMDSMRKAGYSDREIVNAMKERSSRNKKIKAGVIGGMSVASVAGLLAATPGGRKWVWSRLNAFGDKAASAVLKGIKQAPVYKDKAKKAIGQGIKSGVKKGLTEGASNAISKSMGTVMTGGSMYATKLFLDKMLGEDVSGRMFKANDKKKVGSFWNFSEPKEDDEDED